ncbi:MAG: 16S rRNA (uracil(1498)-N(3))-methyltransferase [Chloroflexi bacterium]|nr:16S rRNA (uracil(1498)-N(3))-methyltransferase [Chloroflexota bacterium]
MHRFYISPDVIHEGRVMLRGTIAHQIRDVLRLKPGDPIILLDNSGYAQRADLITVDRDVVRGRIAEKWKLETEPIARVTLYQGLLKGQKFEWVLQKGTELGIYAFAPLITARTMVGNLDEVSPARVERWQKIIVEAAEQSGRARLPHLADALLFKHACDRAARGGLSLIPHEEEKARGLREALAQVPKSREINLFVGPEGGFSEEEIAWAQERGIVAVSLGPRILRAETAGLAATAAILYEMGDLG